MRPQGCHRWLGQVLVAAACLLPSAGAVAQDAPPPGTTAPKPPLQVVIDKSKVDLAGHQLELKASRDLSKVTIKVTGESGAILANEDKDLPPHPANTPLVVRWTPSPDETVTRIEVYCYDPDGYWKAIAITPWAINVPHQDVNFRTDSATIDDPEKPKLEDSFAKVTDALSKHPEIHVTLFIAGHTDTVGDAGYNLKLSRRRAQAIATWFRQRGLKIPIAFEGFGETALLVKTPDETDEPRNRRADYILSVDEPVMKSGTFHPSWTRVP